MFSINKTALAALLVTIAMAFSACVTAPSVDVVTIKGPSLASDIRKAQAELDSAHEAVSYWRDEECRLSVKCLEHKMGIRTTFLLVTEEDRIRVRDGLSGAHSRVRVAESVLRGLHELRAAR